MNALSDALNAPAPAAEPRPRKALSFDWREVVAAPGFRLALALAAGVGLLFWSMLAKLPDLWFANESYYSHGPIVPLLSLYILATRWESVRAKARGASWIPILLLLPVLYLTHVALRTEMLLLLSLLFVTTIGLATWAYVGFGAALAAAPAILYLLFGLPVWQLVIDKFTQPMQVVSADVSYKILEGLGYSLLRADGGTTVYLNNFQMNVAPECSGLRLTLALIAFNVLFMLTAGLRWWANLLLALFTIPFAIVMNAIRVAMIGVVGNQYGADAGHKFHDYSGYIMLALCFVILMKAFQALEPRPARSPAGGAR